MLTRVCKQNIMRFHLNNIRYRSFSSKDMSSTDEALDAKKIEEEKKKKDALMKSNEEALKKEDTGNMYAY